MNYRNTPPTGLHVVFRELRKDKLAFFFLIALAVIIVGIFVWTYFFIDQQQLLRINLRDRFSVPGEKFLLGADQGGKDIVGQMIVGAKNSLLIAISITF